MSKIYFVMTLFLGFSFVIFFFYSMEKIEEYFDKKERYKELIELRNKKREKREERKKEKLIKEIYDIETQYHINEFKRNPELWKQLMRDFKGTNHIQYLFDRYTIEKNGKIYWRY